jgi:hypothetical protein
MARKMVIEPIAVKGVEASDVLVVATPEIERAVRRLARAKRIKKLAEAKEVATGAVVRQYFGTSTALVDATKTELLATYREHLHPQFDEEGFKAEHPQMYEVYLTYFKDKPRRTLLLK